MITNKTRYALKALGFLAEEHAAGRPILIARVATQQKIPRKFLEAILLELKNKGVLQSKKGKGGGYSLAKNPDQIKLIEIMRMVEGPLAPLPCLSKTAHAKCEGCQDEGVCNLKHVMKEAYEAQLKVLEKVSLQDMLENKKFSGAVQTMYYI